MKKGLILIALLAMVSVGSAVSQPRAIGVNLGYGFDLSYQHTVGTNNLIDLSVNLPLVNGIGLGATATYDWVNPFGAYIPWSYEGSWNWNLGAGVGAGVYNLFGSTDLGEQGKKWAGSIYAGVVAHVGVSYDFWFPLQLSLDYRPNIGINLAGEGIGFNTNGFYGVTLGVRYLF